MTEHSKEGVGPVAGIGRNRRTINESQDATEERVRVGLGLAGGNEMRVVDPSLLSPSEVRSSLGCVPHGTRPLVGLVRLSEGFAREVSAHWFTDPPSTFLRPLGSSLPWLRSAMLNSQPCLS